MFNLKQGVPLIDNILDALEEIPCIIDGFFSMTLALAMSFVTLPYAYPAKLPLVRIGITNDRLAKSHVDVTNKI